MKIAVTGATGQLGRLVVEQLREKASGEQQVVALVRTPEKASAMGVEAVPFDYNKAEDLAGALSGIDRLLLISGSEVGQRTRQHANVIHAAKKAGVQWIIYTSLLHADSSSLSLAEEHLATEQAIKESGLAYTILRNGWYTENYTGSVKSALEAGAIVGSAGEGKISSAARADYAEAAATVVLDEKHKGKVYELAGDEAYTLKELAVEISQQTGKDIPFNNLAEAEYAEILKGLGLPEVFAGAIASWDTSASKGDLFDDSRQLSKLIGRQTTSLTHAVRVALK